MKKSIKLVAISAISGLLSTSVLAIGPITSISMPLTNAESDTIISEVPFIKIAANREISKGEADCLPEFIDHHYRKLGLKVNSVLNYDVNNPNDLDVSFTGGYLDNVANTKALSPTCKSLELAAMGSAMGAGNGGQNKTPAVELQTTVINSIDFVSNKFIDSQTLSDISIVKNAIGKTTSVKLLDDVVKGVSNFYKDEGFIVTQVRITDTTDGNIKVTVYEGQIYNIKVDNKSRLSDEDVMDYARESLCDSESPNCQGAPIKTNTFERAIGIVSDLPGLTGITTTMTAGAAPGSSDVTVKVEDSRKVSGYISADNYGAESTGKTRATLGAVGNNLAGIGDQLIAEVSATEISDNVTGQLGYSVPIGHNGWRTGFLFSRAQSYLGSDEFKALDYKVVSNSASLWASYPIIRSQSNNLTFRAAVNSGSSKTTSTVGESDSDGFGYSLGLNGRLIDKLWGRSYTSYGVTANFANLEEEDGSDKDYVKYIYNLSRDQHLVNLNSNSRLSLYLSARGQKAGEDTPHSSQRSSIGGVGGVRAYPGGEASGDETFVTTAELRYSLYIEPVFVTLGVFADRGQTLDIKTDTVAENKLYRSGKGVSANINFLDTIAIRAEYATKNSNSVKPTSDDSRDGKELWLSAVYNF